MALPFVLQPSKPAARYLLMKILLLWASGTTQTNQAEATIHSFQKPFVAGNSCTTSDYTYGIGVLLCLSDIAASCERRHSGYWAR